MPAEAVAVPASTAPGAAPALRCGSDRRKRHGAGASRALASLAGLAAHAAEPALLCRSIGPRRAFHPDGVPLRSRDRAHEPASGGCSPVARMESGSFLLLNRNKRSMTLNLKSAEGCEIFRRLAYGRFRHRRCTRRPRTNRPGPVRRHCHGRRARGLPRGGAGAAPPLLGQHTNDDLRELHFAPWDAETLVPSDVL